MSTASETAKALLSNGKYGEKKESLDKKISTLDNGKRYLIEMSNDILLLEKELEGLVVVDETMVAKLESELESVKNLAIVDDAMYDGTKMVVTTKWMLGYTQADEPFPLPPMSVSLGLTNSDFRAVCIDREEGVRGMWREYDPHPHVNGESGKPCIGTASCSITAMVTAHEYYAAMIMCLDFLQTANESDSAGKYWYRWAKKHPVKLEELLAE